MRFKTLVFAIVIAFLFVAVGITALFFYIITPQKIEVTDTGVEMPKSAESKPTKEVKPTTIIDTKKDLNIKKEESLRIMAVGDILLGRGVKYWVELQKTRYLFPFEKTADILKKGDVIFGNLEQPITTSTKSLTDVSFGGKIILKSSPEAMKGIESAGFNLFSLANNHILDYYEQGLYDTIDALNKEGIAHAGAGKNINEARKLAIIEKKGLKIGLLAYTDMANGFYKGDPSIKFGAEANKSGVAPLNPEFIKEDVIKTKGSVDILIVSLHWGVEDTFTPTLKQTELAYSLLDNGADVILGHHPHHFQGIEIYKGKPIIYSLGNFIFDQRHPENQEGFIMDLEFKSKKLTAITGTPFKILNKFQAVPQTGEGAAELLKREFKLCTELGSSCTIKDDKIVFNINQRE